MIEKIKVKIWRMNVGELFLSQNNELLFQYDENFKKSNLELSPLKLQLKKSKTPFYFKELDYENSPFKGLPGFIADCLPDKFGNELIKEWLRFQNRAESEISVFERLAYIGNRAMGALEFEPILDNSDFNYGGELEVPEIFEIVEEILKKKEKLNEIIDETNNNKISKENINKIISIGTSAGGARAKAIIAIKKEDGSLLKNFKIKAGGIGFKDYEEYLIKFDSALNSDKEEKDGSGYTNIEFSYYLMAKDCGINMSETNLLHQQDNNGNNFYHFLTKRFDRKLNENGEQEKSHVVSLAGLLHNDFNQSRTVDYLDVFNLIDKIVLDPIEKQNNKIELYKRTVFNVFARNQDDHTKNFSFVMNKQGQWSLSPFYDVTFAYNPNGFWTSKHQMTILSHSKNEDITNEVLLTLGEKAGIDKVTCLSVIDKTFSVLENLEIYMSIAKVSEEKINGIKKLIRKRNDFNTNLINFKADQKVKIKKP